ncbi:gamma-type small acid-soluble spore protein [Halobacillus rhizosphaerae]|uniref:gamma-type small acid-soluble spore protein n=1 Tax=Halobacillus rhizosphaerae TaxID=3064889 RepID=UPI00398A7D2B
MAKQPKQNKTAAGTDKNQVRQQNQQAAQKGQQQQYGTEAASQTDAQQVREQNQKSQAKKK